MAKAGMNKKEALIAVLPGVSGSTSADYFGNGTAAVDESGEAVHSRAIDLQLTFGHDLALPGCPGRKWIDEVRQVRAPFAGGNRGQAADETPARDQRQEY